MIEEKYKNLPPKAKERVCNLTDNVDYDVLSVNTNILKCGCKETRIIYQKDFNDFEDTRGVTILDECEQHDPKRKKIQLYNLL